VALMMPAGPGPRWRNAEGKWKSVEKEARTDGGIDRRLRTCPTPLLSNNHAATSPPATAASCCPTTTLCASSCLPLVQSARTRASAGRARRRR